MKSETRYVEEVRQNLIDRGAVNLPEVLKTDGSYNRFSFRWDKPNSKSGWVRFTRLHDGTLVAQYQDWRVWSQGKETNIFKSDGTEKLTPSEGQEMARRQRAEEQLLKRERDHISLWCTNFYKSLPLAPEDHPYLVKKKIQPHGTRIDHEGNLVIPICTEHGTIRSLQYISGTEPTWKRFHKGGEISGLFWWLRGDKSERVFLCEGFGTAATVNEVTHCLTFIAFNCGNLPKVIQTIRKRIPPQVKIIICADNDRPMEGHVHGVGLEEAMVAQKRLGLSGNCFVRMPKTVGFDANDCFCRGEDLQWLMK